MRRIVPIVALLFALPIAAYAALVNINTADLATLETLPGIGPTYAQRIIDYRTAHGPFATTEDIEQVSGIGPATYAKIAPLIMAGGASATTDTSAALSAASSSPSGGAATYVPPPAALSVVVTGDAGAFVEVPAVFTASVTTLSGTRDPSATVTWSFGDGSAAEGTRATKTYRYPGTYAVVATARDGAATAERTLVVTVTAAAVRVSALSGDGITLTNASSSPVDLSGWRIVTDKGQFRIPEGMRLLPDAKVLIPFTIMNLPVCLTAELLYPDGTIAARYLPDPPPVVATTTPVAAPRIAMASPAVPPVDPPPVVAAVASSADAVSIASDTSLAAAAAPALTHSLLASPWTLGFVGVVALAAGAFVLL